MCTFCTLCTLCTLCSFPENVVHFRNHIESSCALGYAHCRNRGRQASFQYSFTPPYTWMCAQKPAPTRWKLVQHQLGVSYFLRSDDKECEEKRNEILRFITGCPKFRHLQCIQSLLFFDLLLKFASLSQRFFQLRLSFLYFTLTIDP